MCVKTTPLHVASSLTADNNEARKPPTISYMCSLAKIYPSRTPLPIEVIDFRYVA